MATIFRVSFKFSLQQCSVTCGSGVQHRNVSCLEYAGGKIIEDKHCSDLRQQQTVRQCNEVSCPEWVQGDDGPVSLDHNQKVVYSNECSFSNQKPVLCHMW